MKNYIISLKLNPSPDDKTFRLISSIVEEMILDLDQDVNYELSLGSCTAVSGPGNWFPDGVANNLIEKLEDMVRYSVSGSVYANVDHFLDIHPEEKESNLNEILTPAFEEVC